MSRHHFANKPFSVSYGAWPALAALGEERKTRVLSQESYIDAREGDSLTTSSEIFIFNRVSDARKNGVFVTDADANKVPHVRANRPLGWFDVTQPAVVYFSSDGMVPMQGQEIVFLTPAQFVAASAIADSSMVALGEGRDSAFAAENVFIEKAHKLAVAGAGGANVFSDLARVAHYMGMPRAKAFAEQEIALAQTRGFSRRNRGGVIAKIID